MSPSEPRTPASRPRGERAKQIFGVAALAVTIVFCLLNTQAVKIHWIVTTTRTPLIVALVVAVILGMIVASALSYRRRRRRRHMH